VQYLLTNAKFAASHHEALVYMYLQCRLYYIRFQYQSFRARKYNSAEQHVWTDGMKWLILAIVATFFTVTYLLTYLLTYLHRHRLDDDVIFALNVVKYFK